MPKFTLNKRFALITGAVVGVAGLTAGILVGCASSDSKSTSTPKPSVSVSASAEPTVAPSPVAAGEPVETDQPLPENAKAFTLADGSTVAVVKDQPLPAAVQEAVQADVNAKAADAMAVSGDSGKHEAARAKAKAAVSSVQSATGKQVIVVFPAWGSIAGDNSENLAAGPVWITNMSAGPGYLQSVKTEGEAVAAAQAFIASQPNPNEWVLIQGVRP